MAFWDIDLETRMGAESAANQGALACFVYCGLSVLSMAIIGSVLGASTPEALLSLALTGGQIVITLVAGFRLRAGKGAMWGSAAAALMAISLLIQIASLSIGFGVIIGVVILVVTIQGVRGAFALRTKQFEEDMIEAFE